MINKSPSGSLCPYYYKGGELHPLKYGSFFADKSKLFTVMKAEEEFILKSSGQNNRRIWIDLYETELDSEVVSALALHIKAMQKYSSYALSGALSLSEEKSKSRWFVII